MFILSYYSITSRKNDDTKLNIHRAHGKKTLVPQGDPAKPEKSGRVGILSQADGSFHLRGRLRAAELVTGGHRLGVPPVIHVEGWDFPWNRRNKPTITWGTPMAEIPICQIHPDPSRSIQIHPDPSRSIQIHPDPSRYAECCNGVMRAQWMTDPVAWVELSWRLSTLSFTQESVPVDEHMHVFSHRGPQDLWRSSKAMVEGVPWCTQKLRASTFGRGQCMSVLSVVVMHARPWIVWEEHASESAKEWPTCEKVYNESNFTTYSIAKKSGTKLTPIKHSADNRNDSGMTGNWDSRALVCSSRILRYIA